MANCTIGPGVSINGRVSGTDDVVVFGAIEGNVVLENTLIVEQGCLGVADMGLAAIVIGGEGNGEAFARAAGYLVGGGLVVGNLRAPRIIIQEGARFRGNLDMDVQLP